MNSNKVAFIFTILVLSFISTESRASFIPVDDWHYTGDAFGGLRQHDNVENIYYAVTKRSRWESYATYEAIDGFHFATYAEYMDLLSSNGPTNWSDLTHYNGRGGWNHYTGPDGKLRVLFRFADTTINKKVVHAGQKTSIFSYTYQPADTYQYQAGFIMIKDPVIAAVSEPSTFAIFALGILGFVFRRFSR